MNRCFVNPANSGHEPMHTPAIHPRTNEMQTFTFMEFSPAPENGPKVDLHICKHCGTVYGTEKPEIPAPKEG